MEASARADWSKPRYIQSPLKGEAASRTVTAAHAHITTIIKLEKTLRLTGWRLEEDIADMRHLTDQKRTAVLAVLKTLIDSIQAWSKQVRIVVADAKKKRPSKALPKKLAKKLG